MKPLLSILCAFAVLARAGPPTTTRRKSKSENWNPPRALILLAAGAQKPAGWSDLRRYTARERSRRWRGFAYFVLGFQEYQRRAFDSAQNDLIRAAETEFPFADVALVFGAEAAKQGGHWDKVASFLKNFNEDYPSSIESRHALRLYAEALIETGRPREAIHALEAYPEARADPELTLLLAQADEKAGDLISAARNDQTVYYNFPTSPESTPAGQALDEIKAQLGEKFPAASEEAETQRAEALYHAERVDEALAEYGRLLTTPKPEPLTWRWNLGRAHCLIRLGRPDEAVETLVGATAPTSELEAERLAVLVDAYEAKPDAASLLRTLDRLHAAYPHSSWYADALSMGAFYFMSQGQWEQAANLYAQLLAAFPGGSLSEFANWRLAWIQYLEGHSNRAVRSLTRFVQRYPESDRVPEALFYIARLEGSRGNVREARMILLLLRRRFVHSYYAIRAREQLKTLRVKAYKRPAPGPHEASPFAQLEKAIPHLPPLTFNPCRATASLGNVRPALALETLHLTPIAVEVLRSQMPKRHSDPGLAILLARMEAENHQPAPAIFDAASAVGDYSDRSYSSLPQALWAILYPRAYWNSVRRLARLRHLDPYLVMGLIRQESAFNPQAESSAGALGLMQVLPETAGPLPRRGIIERELLEPSYNLHAGSLYLHRMMEQFHGNVEQALAAYNAGDVRVSAWVAQLHAGDSADFADEIPWTETRRYVRDVLRDAQVYRELMSGIVPYRRCR